MDMDRFLREMLKQQDQVTYSPLYFVAPHSSDNSFIQYKTEQQISTQEKSPTFQAITTEAFAHFKNAKDGDTCLFFYSGHGSHADAAPEFWHAKPDRQNETLVCLDSRDEDNPSARDLLDKEFAFLLTDALGVKKVHCVLIMDCCHSGGNTRAMIDEPAGIGLRQAPASKNKIALKDYLGFNTGFYGKEGGKAEVPIARYVHLAACLDTEKARESYKGGLFTQKLVEVLRQGGTSKSYRNLVQQLTVTVNGQSEKQNPVSYAREESDLDLRFLGTGIEPYRRSFEVRYDHDRQQWIMYGGAMHNILPSSADRKTMVSINGISKRIEVVEVAATKSVLDKKAMPPASDDKAQFQAYITQMGEAGLKIAVTEAIASNPTKMASLRDAATSGNYLFFSLVTAADPDYLIRLSPDDQFILTSPSSEIPLFKRKQDAAVFLDDVETFSRWTSINKMDNPASAFKPDDFEFNLEIIEGQSLGSLDQQTEEALTSVKSPAIPDQEIVVNYLNDKQPAIRLNINLRNPSLVQCYVGAIYLDPLYGIGPKFTDNGARLQKGGEVLHLQWNKNGKNRRTIPIVLNKEYTRLGINEATGFVKIFVSTVPINVERFVQEGLKMDEQFMQARPADRSIGLEDNNDIDQADWTVFTFPVKTIGPNKQKTITGGTATDLGSVTLEAPQSFTASVFAATTGDVTAKLRNMNRAAHPDALVLSQMAMPPESIWGDVVSGDQVFPTEYTPGDSSSVQVLELTVPGGENANRSAEGFHLSQGEELLIRPKNKTRDIDNEGWEETTIPFGFDEKAQAYFPIGYTDKDGVIHIETLPPETAGVIGSNEKLSRSFGGSVKLFFKKIFRREQVNTLTLYQLEGDGKWTEISTDPAIINTT
ncbi:MAG: caspase family protein, partial [Chitinophagaceae bacterium]